MPKTTLHGGSDKNAKPGDLMDDFCVPDELRKQLEYPAVSKKRQLALEHAEKKLIERLTEVNARLKADRTKVSIQRQGDSLVLQATLPLKPGETSKDGKQNKQTKISLGIPFNLDGLKTAEEEARELGRQVARKMFVWNEKYLRTKAPKPESVQTIADLLKDFESEYFLTRKKNRQSLDTFHNHVGNIKRFLPLEQALSDNAIIEAIQKTDAGSGARQALVSALSVFCNTFKYKFVFKGYKNGYIPKKRKLPTDQQIEQEINKLVAVRSTFQSDAWQWVYGMLATYGLRPHEIFAVNVEKFIDPFNTLHALTLDELLTDGVKTGERVIFPLHPEWVELFKLKNVRMPELVKVSKNSRFLNKSRHISLIFKRKNISFCPYDLRHRYAVRGYELGIPIKEMADNMGHSVEMHTKTYQKYMTIDSRRIVYQNAIVNANKVKSEVEQLKAENAALKQENESLKALLTEYQLDGLLNR